MKPKLKQILAGVIILSVQAIIGQNFTYEWAKFIGGSSTDVGTHIAVDNSGNVYTASCFFNTMDADPSPLGVFNITSAGDFDMFLQKLDASGNFVWAIRIGCKGYDEFTRIAIALMAILLQ
ncbi:MAG: SBBP repeat-containing protein [Flavobacteriales bacterium]